MEDRRAEETIEKQIYSLIGVHDEARNSQILAIDRFENLAEDPMPDMMSMVPNVRLWGGVLDDFEWAQYDSAQRMELG